MHVGDQPNLAGVAQSESGSSDGGASEIASEQRDRPHEELRMLYIGFGTGVGVGVIFLLYIIAATAHWLP